MNPRRLLILTVLAVGCNGATQPTSGPDATGTGKLNIVCTTGMVADIVANVAGDQGTVTPLMGEGVDPHLYKPTTNDVAQLLKADVVFYSGLLLEGPMQDAFERVAAKGKPVFAVTAELDTSYIRTPPHFEGHPDPHVWMDVAAWSRCVDLVAAKLAELRPDHADAFRANAAEYQQELAALDAYAKQVIATIPDDQRVLVTAHDAFEYFSRAYDIPVKSVQGITTESEPGVNDINKLVDFLIEKKVPAIFIESSVSQRNVQAVIEGCKERGWPVSIGGTLYSDAMGPAATYAGTYIGMIDHNATTIAQALGGKVPKGGFQASMAASAP